MGGDILICFGATFGGFSRRRGSRRTRRGRDYLFAHLAGGRRCFEDGLAVGLFPMCSFAVSDMLTGQERKKVRNRRLRGKPEKT